MEMNSSISRAFVRLQRPFPLMRSFFPGPSVFSRRRTVAPFSAARPAAIIPAGAGADDDHAAGIITVRNVNRKNVRG